MVDWRRNKKIRGETSMTENTISLATFYKGWDVYQHHLVTAIAPLTPEQLTLCAASHLMSIGMIATHIIAARVGWFHWWMGEGSAELAPLATWDEEGEPTRSAAELVAGLDVTWLMMRNALTRWTSVDLEQVFQDPYKDEEYRGDKRKYSRQWIIWHVIEHDLHHGGEISLTLGMHGLAAPDL
jgi:uncharacterized damage-inducible protein DinB